MDCEKNQCQIEELAQKTNGDRKLKGLSLRFKLWKFKNCRNTSTTNTGVDLREMNTKHSSRRYNNSKYAIKVYFACVHDAQQLPTAQQLQRDQVPTLFYENQTSNKIYFVPVLWFRFSLSLYRFTSTTFCPSIFFLLSSLMAKTALLVIGKVVPSVTSILFILASLGSAGLYRPLSGKNYQKWIFVWEVFN